MPYKREGKRVFVWRMDRWVLLKVHQTVDAARKHLAALNINVKH